MLLEAVASSRLQLLHLYVASCTHQAGLAGRQWVVDAAVLPISGGGAGGFFTDR